MLLLGVVPRRLTDRTLQGRKDPTFPCWHAAGGRAPHTGYGMTGVLGRRYFRKWCYTVMNVNEYYEGGFH